jgi:hypothetical protein
MLTLQLAKKQLILPSSWVELSNRQLTFAVKMLSAFPLYEAQLRIVFYMMPFAWKRIFKNCSDIERNAIRLEFDFLTQSPVFEKWLFPKIWIGFKPYLGPGDLFGNLNVRQFARANFYLNKYSQSEDEIYLNKFLACIFLGRRDSFSDKILQANYPKFARISKAKKQAIALNFTAVREFVLSQLPYAFTKSDEKSKADKYGWDGMILHIAAKRHQVPDALYNMKLSEFIIQLEVTAIINKESEPNDNS